MAAAWSAAAAAARRGARMAPRSTPASNVQQRGLATGAEQHGAGKVNFWEEPMHPTRWKESHFWLVFLVGGGSLCYGGYKYFYEDKNEKKDETVRKP